MKSNAAYVTERIRSAKCVRILPHTRSDGDALGSAFALARVCAHLGKEAVVTLPDPAPERLRFLCDEAFLGEAEADLVISVDVASPEQLGSLKDEWCGRVDIKLDHHRISPEFGAWSWVVPEAAAAGELVYEIAKEAGAKDAATASLLYAAITSDTGSFRYSNTTGRTFAIAGELAAWGADIAGICEKLFENITMREAHARAHIYGNIKSCFGGRLCTTLITNEQRRALGTLDEDYGASSSLLRGIEGVALAISIKQNEDDPDRYKISMRSDAPIDCAALCAKVGGGGHERAAGATITAPSPEHAEEAVLALCAEVFA